MLIDFTVSNFRSIKTPQTLSFHAAHSLSHLVEHIHYPTGEKVGVLASAGIYGANASGKSNFLIALDALQDMVIDVGNLKDGESIEAYQPYRLCRESQQQPTMFELEFVMEGERYVYKLAYDAARIHEESLDFYPKGQVKVQKANLYTRKPEQDWKEITFGTRFKGGTKRFSFFNNVTYLSKAGNSADAPEKIRQVYDYLRRKLIFLEPNGIPRNSGWKKNEIIVNRVAEILAAIDTGVVGLVIKQENIFEEFLEHFPKIPESIKKKIEEDVNSVPYLEHLSETGNRELFSGKDESTGTRALLNILPILLEVIANGAVMIWDEIESSLHPHIAELVVKLFHDPQVNTHHAQLLFTTHNLSLMTPELFRKDQLWLTEKKHGNTLISSLDEFDAGLKAHSPFAKWYDEGRLGGIPMIDYYAVKALFTRKPSAEHAEA